MSRQVQVPGTGIVALAVAVVAFVILLIIGYGVLAALFFALVLAAATAAFLLVARSPSATGAPPGDVGRWDRTAETGPTAAPAGAGTRTLAGAAPSTGDSAVARARDNGAPASGEAMGTHAAGNTVAAPAEAEPKEAEAERAQPEAAPVGATLPEAADEAPGRAAPAETEPLGIGTPREGGADDLKRIRGIGPRLEDLLHQRGIYHFDQIAAWGPSEIAWMDEHLEDFRGRVSRDDWVGQARRLADETEVSHGEAGPRR